jgi:hypothetical protein
MQIKERTRVGKRIRKIPLAESKKISAATLAAGYTKKIHTAPEKWAACPDPGAV